MHIAYSIEEFLTNPKVYSKLCIRAGNITNDNLVKFTQALKVNQSLSFISFCSNELEDIAVKAICDSLKDNKMLNTIYFQDNYISEAMARSIKKILPHVGSLELGLQKVSKLPVVEAAPPVVEAAPPVVEAAPPVVEAALPVVEAAPPVVEAAPPVVEAAPPVVEDMMTSIQQLKKSLEKKNQLLQQKEEQIKASHRQLDELREQYDELLSEQLKNLIGHHVNNAEEDHVSHLFGENDWEHINVDA